MRTREGMLLNVVVRIVGAALGGWFLSPLAGVSTINQSNFSATVAAETVFRPGMVGKMDTESVDARNYLILVGADGLEPPTFAL